MKAKRSQYRAFLLSLVIASACFGGWMQNWWAGVWLYAVVSAVMFLLVEME